MRSRYVLVAAGACVVLIGLLVIPSERRRGGRSSAPGTLQLEPAVQAKVEEHEATMPLPTPETPAVEVAAVPGIPIDLAPAAMERLTLKDREALERHLHRFGDGGQAAAHWSDEPVGSIPRALAKGIRLAKDAAASEGRRLEQLEALRQREALGLLDPIAAGLAWLVVHQGPDGAFQDDVAAVRCRELGHMPQPCVARTEPTGPWSYPPAGTALAVMALLDFRDQDARGIFEPAIARGVAYLCSKQAADGSFPGASATCSALSLIALARAAEAIGDVGLRDAVRRGLAHKALQAAPDGGYRYPPFPYGDLRETAWVAQAVATARRAGVEPPDGMTEGISRFLDSVWQGGHRFSRERGGRDMDWLSPIGMHTGLLAWDGGRLADVLDEWRLWVKQTAPVRVYTLYYGVRVATTLEPDLPENWRDALFGLANAQERSAAVGAWRGTGTGLLPLSEGGYAGVGVVHFTAVAVLTLERALWAR